MHRHVHSINLLPVVSRAHPSTHPSICSIIRFCSIFVHLFVRLVQFQCHTKSHLASINSFGFFHVHCSGRLTKSQLNRIQFINATKATANQDWRYTANATKTTSNHASANRSYTDQCAKHATHIITHNAIVWPISNRLSHTCCRYVSHLPLIIIKQSKFAGFVHNK